MHFDSHHQEIKNVVFHGSLDAVLESESFLSCTSASMYWIDSWFEIYNCVFGLILYIPRNLKSSKALARTYIWTLLGLVHSECLKNFRAYYSYSHF